MRNALPTRVSHYVKHIGFCFRTTPRGSRLTTMKVAGAYLGLHMGMFKSRHRTLQARFDDFDVDLNIYSREIAGYWEIFQEHQYLDLPATHKDQEVVVLDIGANVGFFALSQALKHKERLRLIGFEPDPATFSRLKANIGRNAAKMSPNISCYNCAIDTHIGQAKFLQDMSVESRILDDDSTEPSITVDIITLDSVIEREGIEKIDLMKIDVEGHELKVLESGKKALAITENITLEYHAPHFVEEITTMLAPDGFRLVNHNSGNAIISFSKTTRPQGEVFAAPQKRRPGTAMA